MDRDAVLAPILDSLEDYSREDARKALEHWQAVPFMVGGQHIGSAVMSGTEVHFALARRPCGCTRGAIKALLEPLFESAGFLTTRVRIGRLKETKFVERVGFKPTWRDEQFQYYLLGQMPFARS